MKRHALITGGGSGIGLACAQRLKADGVNVTIAGRTQSRLEQSGFAYVVMDVTDKDSVDTACAQAAKQGGAIDIFVANAGAAKTAPALKTSLELWNDMIAVNMTGAFLCAQAVLPAMKQEGFGRFIVVASTSAMKAYPYTMAYAAAKHGVLGMVRSFALELAKTGVTCNAVCPGFTNTNIVQDAVKNIMEKTGRSEQDAVSAFTTDNPMNRLITPQEVADTISYLCGTGAASVNGQALLIDGGEVFS